MPIILDNISSTFPNYLCQFVNFQCVTARARRERRRNTSKSSRFLLGYLVGNELFQDTTSFLLHIPSRRIEELHPHITETTVKILEDQSREK